MSDHSAQREGQHRRESVWSIDQGRRVAFFLLFVLQTTIWTILITIEDIAHGGHNSIRSLAIAVAQGVSPLIIVNVATTVILLQGVELMLFTREYLRDRFIKPMLEEREARDIAKGRSEMYQKWDEWNRRRLSAEAAGIRFDESPPQDPDAE